MARLRLVQVLSQMLVQGEGGQAVAVLGYRARARESCRAVQWGTCCAQHVAKGLAWDCCAGTQAVMELRRAPQAVGAHRDALQEAQTGESGALLLKCRCGSSAGGNRARQRSRLVCGCTRGSHA